MIHKYINLDIIYRDNGNYKNNHNIMVWNDLELDDEHLTALMDQFIVKAGKMLWAPGYKLDQFAHGCPWDLSNPNDIDHCYTEIVDWEFKESDPGMHFISDKMEERFPNGCNTISGIQQGVAGSTHHGADEIVNQTKEAIIQKIEEQIRRIKEKWTFMN